MCDMYLYVVFIFCIYILFTQQQIKTQLGMPSVLSHSEADRNNLYASTCDKLSEGLRTSCLIVNFLIISAGLHEKFPLEVCLKRGVATNHPSG